MRARALLAALGALALGSCASISEEACVAGDWRGVGFRDGAAGRSDGYVANHAEACAAVGVRPDVALWRSGRAEGLALYCTPANAYELGTEGRGLNPVCGGHDARRLARANAEGWRYRDITREMARLEYEIAELDARIDALREGDVGRAERRLIRAYRDDIERSERFLRLLGMERAGYRPLWF